MKKLILVLLCFSYLLTNAQLKVKVKTQEDTKVVLYEYDTSIDNWKIIKQIRQNEYNFIISPYKSYMIIVRNLNGEKKVCYIQKTSKAINALLNIKIDFKNNIKYGLFFKKGSQYKFKPITRDYSLDNIIGYDDKEGNRRTYKREIKGYKLSQIT